MDKIMLELMGKAIAQWQVIADRNEDLTTHI
jgi:hypothetical protein